MITKTSYYYYEESAKQLQNVLMAKPLQNLNYLDLGDQDIILTLNPDFL